jgi:hypothetical protein
VGRELREERLLAVEQPDRSLRPPIRKRTGGGRLEVAVQVVDETEGRSSQAQSGRVFEGKVEPMSPRDAVRHRAVGTPKRRNLDLDAVRAVPLVEGARPADVDRLAQTRQPKPRGLGCPVRRPTPVGPLHETCTRPRSGDGQAVLDDTHRVHRPIGRTSAGRRGRRKPRTPGRPATP